jgi:ribosome modulation factor
MNDFEPKNPYDKKENPELHDAWTEGVRDGHDGKAIEEQVYNTPEKFSAYIEGYRAATD